MTTGGTGSAAIDEIGRPERCIVSSAESEDKIKRKRIKLLIPP